jgi:hypothetical protein
MKALVIIGLALAAGSSMAQVKPAATVPAMPVFPGFSTTAFTIPPTTAALSAQGSTTMLGDPPGTRYAITSFTATNESLVQAQTVKIQAKSGSVSGSCQLLFNVQDQKAGPIAVVPVGSTVQLTFPQPFVTEALTGGPNVCLVGSGDPTAYVGLSWSVVGYKILP